MFNLPSHVPFLLFFIKKNILVPLVLVYNVGRPNVHFVYSDWSNSWSNVEKNPLNHEKASKHVLKYFYHSAMIDVEICAIAMRNYLSMDTYI